MPKNIPIKVYRQKRRSMMMRAVPGVVEVFIPYQLHEKDRQVQDFIATGLQKLEGKMLALPPDKTTRQAIKRMVGDYARRMQVTPSRIQFRDMRRKWGSCSGIGSITLNTRLTWLDPHLAEYIACHEVAHLIELNHSRKFWAIVEQHMPDYQQRMQTLREIEQTLW